MAQAVSPEAVAALRARVSFLRDLGIHDLFRRPVPEADAAVSKPAVQAALPMAPQIPAPAEVPLILETQEHEVVTAPKRVQLPSTLPVLPSGEPLPPEARARALEHIREEIGDCTRCPLAYAGRHTIVFGDGDPNARLLFVGEGPGADEDAQGIPFIGKAGQLLNNMITAMGLGRSDVYIANIVKCRPPGNRVPEPVEANTCTPFLLQQIGVVRPAVIVALGSTAATYLLGAKSPLSALRGRVHPALGTKLIVTYHPAYLLRDPRQKKEAWADLQLAMRELG